MILKKSRIPWNAAMVISNTKTKKSFSQSQAGTRHTFIVSRSGELGVTIMDVTTKDGKTVQAANGSGLLKKKIYNLEAQSDEAVDRLMPIYFDAGVEAEAAGNKELAADLFNAYLNGTAISFNVLSTSPLYNFDLTSCEIEATLELVTTEVGTLLTIDTRHLRIIKATAGKSGQHNADKLSARMLPNKPITGDAPIVPPVFDPAAIVS